MKNIFFENLKAILPLFLGISVENMADNTTAMMRTTKAPENSPT